MRYRTDIDKSYLSFFVDSFETELYKTTESDFNKRSSVTGKGGRPYLYSPREIGEQMVIYFRNCIEYDQPFMVTGLCLHLVISRRGLLNLQKSYIDEFVHVIQKGKQIIETYLEIQLHLKPNPRLPIFVLKNMGWKEK